MRRVVWEDRNGWKHVSLVRDDDPDDAAPSGILQDPPDLNGLDCETLRKEIHNWMIDAGMFTWRDVQNGQGQLASAIYTLVKRRVTELFKLKEVTDGRR